MSIVSYKSLLTDAAELRRQAEERLCEKRAKPHPPRATKEAQRILHELEVHQVELEMQNAELRQARNDLETALEKYTDLYEFAPIAYFTLDRSGAISAVNLSGTRLFGIVRSQLIGRRFWMLVTENCRPAFNAFLDIVFTSLGKEACEVSLLNKGNLPLIVQVEAVATASGQECLLTLNDITGLRQNEEKLLRSRKLETLGQIAGGVAHEVRNPLHAILTITEALFKEEGIAGNSEFEPYILHIRTQVNRLAFLMNEFLSLGRSVPVSSICSVPLYDCCLEAIDIWNSFGSAQIIPVTVIVDSDQVKICVMADRERLVQVIYNLLENAAQHSSGKGKITLRIFDKEACDLPSPIAVIRITDAGSDIPPENLSRVFDPFYSGRMGGTGLGLALVKHLVEEMGGAVALFNNDPPPGCSAEVHIPRSSDTQSPAVDSHRDAG